MILQPVFPSYHHATAGEKNPVVNALAGRPVFARLEL